METLFAAAVLLLTAIVVLLVYRITRAERASREPSPNDTYTTRLQEMILDHSAKAMEIALQRLEQREKEAKRDETLMQVAQHLLKLDTTVSNLFLQLNNRTVLRPAVQHGEEPERETLSPQPMSRMDWRPPMPPPVPEGLEEKPAVRKADAPVSAEAT